jgi:hypothetical protein
VIAVRSIAPNVSINHVRVVIHTLTPSHPHTRRFARVQSVHPRNDSANGARQCTIIDTIDGSRLNKGRIYPLNGETSDKMID